MARTRQAPAQQQQIAPGSFFRVPGVGARTRFVPETGPCAPSTAFTGTSLATTSSTTLKLGKMNTLDIVNGYVMETIITTKYTKGSGKTLYPSPYVPGAIFTLIQVQFESAYSTFRLPGFLAQTMQQYRSMFAPNSQATSMYQGGANAFAYKKFGTNWLAAYTKELMPTPTLSLTPTGTAQTYRVLWEIPVAMYFDLYYTLNTNGIPRGRPIPRAIVSPQRMAASTRNVIPRIVTNVLLGTNNRLGNFVSKVSGDTTSAVATQKITMSWWRTAWIPTDTMATEPPGRAWQYTRDYIQFQPSGAQSFAIPVDDQIPGQGQVLSLVFMTWTPAATSTRGNYVGFTHYTNVQLLLGSSIQLENTNPTTNQYRWLLQHGAVLPAGFLGWDYALMPTGKITNERAVNTLVQAGFQIRIQFKSTFTPNSKATVYVGLEVLKKVGQ